MSGRVHLLVLMNEDIDVCDLIASFSIGWRVEAEQVQNLTLGNETNIDWHVAGATIYGSSILFVGLPVSDEVQGLGLRPEDASCRRALHHGETILIEAFSSRTLIDLL